MPYAPSISPCLPFDVLQEVFWEVVARPTEPQANVDTYSPKARSQLLNLSHISRAWRRAATSRADLWAEVLDPRDPSPDLFDLIYRRTRQAPLKLRAQLWRDEVDKTPIKDRPQWVLMMSNVHRMSVIVFHFRWKEDLEPLLQALSEQETPLLEVFNLYFRGIYNGRPDRLAFTKPLKTSNLRVLSLEACIVSPDSLDLEHLETVYLRRRSAGIGEASAWWNLCFSGRMPSLRTLSITHLLHSSNTPNHRVLESFSAPQNLQLLQLTATIAPCVYLLERTPDLPALCNIKLVCYPNSDELSVDPAGLVNSLFSFLSRLWGPASSAASSLEICIKDDTFSLTHHSIQGRTIQFRAEFGSGKTVFVKQALRYLASDAHCPGLGSDDTWLRLNVSVVNREYAKEIHVGLVHFLTRSKFGSQVRRLRLDQYSIGTKFAERSGQETNLFTVQRETEGIVLPSLKHICIRHQVLWDRRFIRDFNYFEEQRPIDIVEVTEEWEPDFRSRILLAGFSPDIFH